jgi:hypothetical protein
VTSNADHAIEADLQRLDVGLRKLKVQYDMFFAGALPRQPVELRSEIERLVARYSKKPMGKYAHRFRFNALVGRFNSMSELWGKMTRSKEEGEQRSAGMLDRFAMRERLVARCRVRAGATDDVDLRRLHRRFSDATLGQGGRRAPTYESFLRGVEAQAARLRQKSGCDEIELRVVVRDDRIQLTARPRR